MSEVARLCDVTTVPGSAEVERFNLIIGNVPGLDGLEYHLGMSRGEISDYTEMMTVPLHRDMIELFRTSSWALLPASDVIEKIWHLYNYNQSLSTATLSRKKFTEELPVSQDKLYQYELLPICTADKLPIYIGEKRYDYPYNDLPRVETSIHPCFVFKSLCKYLVRGNLAYAPNSLTDDAQRRSRIGSIGITASLCVKLSWLHGTWEDFPDRPSVLARPDPVPKDAPPNQEQEDDAIDEPRDLYDPRTLFVVDAMEKYMAKHNKRIEVEEAEKEAQHTPLVVEQRIPSDSSLESINSTDVQPPTTGPPRRSQRAKSTTVMQPTVASRKRARAAVSSSGSSIDESPSKRQRSNKQQAAKKKSSARSSPAVDDSTAPPPPAVRRSTRTRKIVSR